MDVHEFRNKSWLTTIGHGSSSWLYPELFKASWCVFRSCYEKQELCDVIIKCKSSEFRAHRLLLASVSPYFNSLFLGPLSLSTSSSFQVCSLDDFSPQIVTLLLDVIYTKRPLHVSDCDLVEAIRLADFLQIDKLVELFIMLCSKRLCVDNCLSLLREAVQGQVDGWARRIRTFIASCFMKLIASETFGHLSAVELHSLITSKELSCYPSRVLCYAALTWSRFQGKSLEPSYKCLLMSLFPSQDAKEGLSSIGPRFDLDLGAESPSSEDLDSFPEHPGLLRELLTSELSDEADGCLSRVESCDILVHTCESRHVLPFKDLALLSLKSGLVRFLNQGFGNWNLVPELSYYDPVCLHYFTWRCELYVAFTETSESHAGDRLIIKRYDFVTESWQEKFFDTLRKHLHARESLPLLTSCICCGDSIHLLFNDDLRSPSEFTSIISIDLRSFSVTAVRSLPSGHKGFAVDSRRMFTVFDYLPPHEDPFFLVEYDRKVYMFTPEKKDGDGEAVKVWGFNLSLNCTGWQDMALIESPCYLASVFIANNRCFLVYRLSDADQTCRISEYKFGVKFDGNEFVDCPVWSRNTLRFVVLSHCLV